MKYKIITIIFYLSLAYLILPQHAQAAEYYVDAVNGNDANPGTSELPWKTLNRAYTWYSGAGPKVQEGDTVLFRNGSYGEFKESSNDYYLRHFHRTNWITYKAATGHNPELSGIVVINEDHQSQPLYEPGESYLIFDGFTINGTVLNRKGCYFKILNCDINVPTKNYDGIYAPYVYTSAISLLSVSYLTIDNCQISNALKGMYFHGTSHDVIVTNNHIHRIGGDGIKYNGVTNGLFENNRIENINAKYAYIAIYGTKTGEFTPGELVTQADSGATGYFHSWSGSYGNFFQKTATPFKNASEGGGTISGATATLSNITKIDHEHTDIIETHSYSHNITIRRNICIAYAAQGITIYGYGNSDNYLVENNLVVGPEKPFMISGATGFRFNNNIGIGPSSGNGTRFDVSSANSPWEYLAVEVTEFYNNILSQVLIMNDNVHAATETGCVYTSSTGNLYKEGGWPIDGHHCNYGTWAVVTGPTIKNGTYIVTAQTDTDNIIIDAGLGDDNNVSVTLWGAVKVVSHGNNIIGNNLSGTYGTLFPFSINSTELINTIPTFVNAANNDYRPASGSAAIDFGNPDYGPKTDILGNPRDAYPDAGCYEYAEASGDILGDITGDGEVSINDVQACVSIILFAETDLGMIERADISGETVGESDGFVNIYDLQELVNMVLSS